MFLTDFWKKLRIYLWSLGIFISQWVLASWLPIFVTAEPSQTISIDRSEPRFDSHTGSKIRKTLKTMEILMFLVNFWLNHIQNCFTQITKIKDKIFGFQLKKNYIYFHWMLTDDARHKNVLLPLGLTRILKS